jgi:capsular exopolysaccharide synthesis family protein
MPERTIQGRGAEGHLRDYWRVVWNGRWTVVSIFAVTGVLGTVATLLQKPVYEAVATLEINARPRGVVQGTDVAQLGATEFGYLAEERYYNTQSQILRSRSVAARVMKKLDLYQVEPFAGEKDPEQAFIERIVVEPVQETGLVRVKVRAGDPRAAQLWANEVAHAYRDRNLEEATRKTEAALDKLRTRLKPLGAELRQTEDDRLDEAEREQLYVSQDPQKAFQERLKILETDLTETEVKRLELDGVHAKIREIEAEGGDFLVIPQVQSDPTIRALADERIKLETEIRRLEVTFKQGHYKVKEKESELAKIQQKLDGEVRRVVAGIQTQYSLLTDRQRELKQAISQTNRDSVALGRKASAYETAKTDATETRKIYDLISMRLKEVELNAELLMNNVAIVDEAILPAGPVSPKRRLNVALSGVLGLALGLGTVFFLDYLDNTVKTSEDVEQYLGLSILAIVPRRDASSENIVKESLQSLRTNVNFSSLNRSRKRILVTSAGPQEGKTSTLVALAKAQAAAGDRVAVVDCDLRRPNVHNCLGLKRNFGLTNFLADATEDGSWRKYLKTTSLPNLHVLTCGPIPPNPPELFGTDRFRRLLEDLREEYDWVLLDAPPVASLSDAIILASVCDMITFVIRHRQTDRELIRRAVEAIRAVNPHVIGAVMNDVDLDRTHYRDYYYAGHYYYGTGESGEKEPRKSLRWPRRVG